MYTPTAGSLVPYLPEEAFTGVRVTYLDQGGHELWDDFRNPHWCILGLDAHG